MDEDIRCFISSDKIRNDMRGYAEHKKKFLHVDPVFDIPDVDTSVSNYIIQYLQKTYGSLLDGVVECNQSSRMAVFRFIVKELVRKTISVK